MEKNYYLETSTQESQGTKRRPYKKVSSTAKFLIYVGLPIFLTIIFALYGVKRMKDSFDAARESASSSFYKTAYDIAEGHNHVSNYVTVAIEAEREVSRLEVLTVSNSEFIIKDAGDGNNTTSWLEVQGTGVFTVDLDAAEFIADSERQYVLVRIPNPVLTNCAVSGIGKQFWNSSNFPLTNGSIAEGVRLSQEQFAEGRIRLEDSIRQNRRFHEAAQSAARLTIESIVKKWNPSIPDLQVEVEFITNKT